MRHLQGDLVGGLSFAPARIGGAAAGKELIDKPEGRVLPGAPLGADNIDLVALRRGGSNGFWSVRRR